MAITYNNLYLDIRQVFRDSGIEAATLEARELVCYASGKTREELARDARLYVPPAVEEKIRDFALAEGELGSRRNSRIVTSVRHKAMLEEAASSLEDAVRAAESGAPLEIVDIDVENVYRALGFITGDSVQSDVIDEVFSRFCLGK